MWLEELRDLNGQPATYVPPTPREGYAAVRVVFSPTPLTVEARWDIIPRETLYAVASTSVNARTLWFCHCKESDVRDILPEQV